MTTRYLGLRQVAEYLQCQQSTVNELARDGLIPPPALHRRVAKWDKRVLDRLIDRVYGLAGSGVLVAGDWDPMDRRWFIGGADEVDPVTGALPARIARPPGFNHQFCYTVEQAANLLGIGLDLAYKRLRQGKITSIKVGRRYFVPRDAILGE